jgi:hypothetical protein
MFGRRNTRGRSFNLVHVGRTNVEGLELRTSNGRALEVSYHDSEGANNAFWELPGCPLLIYAPEKTATRSNRRSVYRVAPTSQNKHERKLGNERWRMGEK